MPRRGRPSITEGPATHRDDVSNDIRQIANVPPRLVRQQPPSAPVPPSILTFAARIKLTKPCAEGLNLLSCLDFTNEQPYSPATMPARGHWAPDGECPKCDYEQYDMRRRRVVVIRKTGVRLGTGPGKKDAGCDCLCCAVM